MSAVEMSAVGAAVPLPPLRRIQPRRATAQVRLFIADSNALFRQALRMFLEADGSFGVIGESADGRDALSEIERLQPDIAIVDLGLPSLNGVEVARRLGRESSPTKVIVLASRSEESLLVRSFGSGVAGYLLKDADLQELTIAIRKVSAGYSYVSLSLDSWPLAKSLPDSRERRSSPSYDLLTSRERELLQLVAEGYTNKEIADQLCVSVKTVEAHKANICGKLNVRGSAGLVRHAIHASMIGMGV